MNPQLAAYVSEPVLFSIQVHVLTCYRLDKWEWNVKKREQIVWRPLLQMLTCLKTSYFGLYPSSCNDCKVGYCWPKTNSR